MPSILIKANVNGCDYIVPTIALFREFLQTLYIFCLFLTVYFRLI